MTLVEAQRFTICIIDGTTDYGHHLASAWTAVGHTVTLGTSGPDVTEAMPQTPHHMAGDQPVATIPNSDAAREADIVVAVGAHELIAPKLSPLVGACEGKIVCCVVECQEIPDDHQRLQTFGGASNAERCQRLLTDSRIYGVAYEGGTHPGGRPVSGADDCAFICGDDRQEATWMTSLFSATGSTRHVYCGPLYMSRLTENVIPAFVSINGVGMVRSGLWQDAAGVRLS